VPDEPLPPEGSLGFRVNLYGMETWGDLFTPRQALALSTFVRLVREAHQEVLRETGDAGFARAVATCLAVAVSNLVPYA
jgi:putative DNA methylase